MVLIFWATAGLIGQTIVLGQSLYLGIVFTLGVLMGGFVAWVLLSIALTIAWLH